LKQAAKLKAAIVKPTIMGILVMIMGILAMIQ
jgi:hypothetical protein